MVENAISTHDGICNMEPCDAVAYRKKLQFFKAINPKYHNYIFYREMQNKLEMELDNHSYLTRKGIRLALQKSHLIKAALNSRVVVIDYYGTVFFNALQQIFL